MTARHPRRSPRATCLVAVLLGCLFGGEAAAGVEGAAAAQAPLTSTTLMARSFGMGAITSSFSDANGTSLTSTVDACGSPWTVAGGTMRVTTDQRAISDTSALVTATVPLCGATGVNVEAGGDVRPAGTANFGVLVNAADGGRPSTAVVFSNTGSGSVEIRRIPVTGTPTTWAKATNVGNGNTTRHLRVTYLNGVYTVYLGGSVVLTHTIDAATRSSVEANTAVGIAAFSDTTTTFDNFQGYPR